MTEFIGAVFMAVTVFTTFQIVRFWVVWELMREEEE